ncbi:hypothetical protein FS749_009574 [Ceratobasidium sp. UAMH 11750]|nr:hypothetical protein FS749_009574 [Ceratobasidium sp. UAMH 11750]
MRNCPIDGLPSEILSQIFVTLNEAGLHARSIKDESYGSMDYPNSLLNVCSRWRHIALATPHLWSYIDFATARGTLRNLELVKRYFHRAQNAPLRIRIGMYDIGLLQQNVDSNLEYLLRSSVPRLESLAIDCLHSSFATQAISILFSNAETSPILKLALSMHPGGKRILADEELLPQECLDRLFEPLQSLYLHYVSPDWQLLACRNLVELQLIKLPPNGNPSVQQLETLLRANPGLCFVKFEQFLLSFDRPVSFQPIRLSHLEELELAMNPHFIDWFIGILAPGSHDLTICLASWWTESERPDITGTFLAFSKRARITSLHISGICLLLSRLYDNLPHLRILRLSTQIIFESTFMGLREAASPLPCLHTFEILSCGYDESGLYGLQAICKIGSLRRIKFRYFESYEQSCTKTSTKKALECFAAVRDGRIEIIDSPELEFYAHASPFY